jgi:hypothetical protein
MIYSSMFFDVETTETALLGFNASGIPFAVALYCRSVVADQQSDMPLCREEWDQRSKNTRYIFDFKVMLLRMADMNIHALLRRASAGLAIVPVYA